MASATPPRALPSILVKIIPVTFTTSVNIFACCKPFCPVVASITNSTSLIGKTFSTTRFTFSSSAIKSFLLCNRPAVSIIRKSALLSCAFLAASNATEAGSPLALPETTSTPILVPQVCNCSTAAARKVSPAAITTFLPPVFSCAASFATLVVFPVPLTPTTMMTVVSCPKRAPRSLVDRCVESI